MKVSMGGSNVFEELAAALEDFIFSKALNADADFGIDDAQKLEKIKTLDADTLEAQIRTWKAALVAREDIIPHAQKAKPWYQTEEEKAALIVEAEAALRYFTLLDRFKQVWWPRT
jgi:hypothetical protein